MALDLIIVEDRPGIGRTLVTIAPLHNVKAISFSSTKELLEYFERRAEEPLHYLVEFIGRGIMESNDATSNAQKLYNYLQTQQIPFRSFTLMGDYSSLEEASARTEKISEIKHLPWLEKIRTDWGKYLDNLKNL